TVQSRHSPLGHGSGGGPVSPLVWRWLSRLAAPPSTAFRSPKARGARAIQRAALPDPDAGRPQTSHTGQVVAQGAAERSPRHLDSRLLRPAPAGAAMLRRSRAGRLSRPPPE